MQYLLDTDICSAHLRKISQVTNRFILNSDGLSISVLTLGELLSWTLRHKSVRKYHESLKRLLSGVRILDADQAVAHRFGEIRARLLDLGQPIAAVDLLIGSTALVHGMTVVTHNVRHFSKIPELQIEDWLAD